MVRALEREMLKRIRAQGLNMTPQIIVITRLIPEALGAPWSRHVQQAPASAACIAQMWHCPSFRHRCPDLSHAEYSCPHFRRQCLNPQCLHRILTEWKSP